MYGLYEKLYLRTSRCKLKNVIFVSGRKGTGIYKSVKYLTAIMNEYDLYEKQMYTISILAIRLERQILKVLFIRCI